MTEITKLTPGRLSADPAAAARSNARVAGPNATRGAPATWRRRIAGAGVQASAVVDDVPGARAIITVALAARGLVEIFDAIGRPWTSLVEALLLATLALGFFAAPPRSHRHRSGWLLSGSVATGLAIARLYDFIGDAVTPAFPVTCLVICIVLLLFVTRRAVLH